MLNNESSRLKFDTNRGFGIQAKLIPSKTGEYLRFTDGGVADQHHLEHVVDLLARVAVPTARHFTSRRIKLTEFGVFVINSFDGL